MSTEKPVKTLEMTDRGFTITKEISRRNGEHIQVELEITSRHDEKTSVDLAEQIPTGTKSAQIGFLPDNEPDEWRTTDPDILLLQAKLVPEGTRRIVYGVQEVEGDEVEPMMEKPQITAVGGADTEASAPETEPQDTAEPEPEPDATDETPSQAETSAESAEPPEDDTETDEQSEETEASESFELPLDEETAEALAGELEPHLDDGETDAVTETKLTQLQEDVAEVRTYLPAFKEFLGEAGRADDITEQLEDLQEEVEGMDELPDEFDEIIDRIEGQVDDVADTAQRLDEQLELIEERLGQLEEWREDIAAASQ